MRQLQPRPSGERRRSEEPLVAHVFGDVPPDFAAIAACGFGIVCLDSTAPWFREVMLTRAREEGMLAFAFPMRCTGG